MISRKSYNCASGLRCIEVVRRSPYLVCYTSDLLAVASIARENVTRNGLSDRITSLSGNLFEDDFPEADVITMGNILHDWNLDRKLQLLDKAYQGLLEGSAFIAIKNIIDDERQENSFGLLMSLNMLIELGNRFDYTGADFDRWAHHLGFRETYVMPLTGPSALPWSLNSRNRYNNPTGLILIGSPSIRPRRSPS